jgi:hypothetical protein
MRERHKGLVGSWKEVTDPYKHVFEVSFCFVRLGVRRRRIFEGNLAEWAIIGYRDCDVFDVALEGYVRGLRLAFGSG